MFSPRGQRDVPAFCGDSRCRTTTCTRASVRFSIYNLSTTARPRPRSRASERTRHVERQELRSDTTVTSPARYSNSLLSMRTPCSRIFRGKFSFRAHTTRTIERARSSERFVRARRRRSDEVQFLSHSESGIIERDLSKTFNLLIRDVQ